MNKGFLLAALFVPFPLPSTPDGLSDWLTPVSTRKIDKANQQLLKNVVTFIHVAEPLLRCSTACVTAKIFLSASFSHCLLTMVCLYSMQLVTTSSVYISEHLPWSRITKVIKKLFFLTAMSIHLLHVVVSPSAINIASALAIPLFPTSEYYLNKMLSKHLNSLPPKEQRNARDLIFKYLASFNQSPFQTILHQGLFPVATAMYFSQFMLSPSFSNAGNLFTMLLLSFTIKHFILKTYAYYSDLLSRIKTKQTDIQGSLITDHFLLSPNLLEKCLIPTFLPKVIWTVLYLVSPTQATPLKQMFSTALAIGLWL